jgi:hypothetical protein
MKLQEPPAEKKVLHYHKNLYVKLYGVPLYTSQFKIQFFLQITSKTK